VVLGSVRGKLFGALLNGSNNNNVDGPARTKTSTNKSVDAHHAPAPRTLALGTILHQHLIDAKTLDLANAAANDADWTPPSASRSTSIFSALSAQPPRDTHRQVIMQGWTTLVPSIDAMVPIGLGQSMLFFDQRASLLQETYKALSQPHFPLPLPMICGDDDLALTLGAYLACEQAEIERDSGQHAVLVSFQAPFLLVDVKNELTQPFSSHKKKVIPDLTPMRIVWMRVMQLLHKASHALGSLPATDRGEVFFSFQTVREENIYNF